MWDEVQCEGDEISSCRKVEYACVNSSKDTYGLGNSAISSGHERQCICAVFMMLTGQHSLCKQWVSGICLFISAEEFFMMWPDLDTCFLSLFALLCAAPCKCLCKQLSSFPKISRSERGERGIEKEKVHKTEERPLWCIMRLGSSTNKSCWKLCGFFQNDSLSFTCRNQEMACKLGHDAIVSRSSKIHPVCTYHGYFFLNRGHF